MNASKSVGGAACQLTPNKIESSSPLNPDNPTPGAGSLEPAANPPLITPSTRPAASAAAGLLFLLLLLLLRCRTLLTAAAAIPALAHAGPAPAVVYPTGIIRITMNEQHLTRSFYQ
jgi:hypothetical protein